ncbi:DUF222 domain-containing protein [Georgenia daeguensis]|uniref:DAD domain-containing protein n=1 Tax=Georgenia daeguensis TaxID=908355 RepID=A0ABP8EP91_9MICO
MVAQQAGRTPSAEPTPVSLLTAVRCAVEALRAAAPDTGAREWPHADREIVITSLDRLIQDLTLYRGKVLLAHRDDGRWGTARDRDFQDWRSRTTGAGRGAAIGELQVAEGLEAMPEVDAAIAEGALTLEHAKTLARIRAGASEEVKEALANGMAAELVEKGKKLTAPELAKAAKKVAATIDARAAQESFEVTWRRRSVTTGRTGGARTGAWVLDDVSGTLIETALDAIAGAPAQDDDRTREQRRADALVTMASRTLQVGSDLNGAQIRPHVALIVDEETWAAARRHGEALAAAGESEVDAAHGRGAAFGLGPDGQVRTTSEVEADRGEGRAADGCSLTGGGRAPTRPDSHISTGLPAAPDLPAVAPAELEDGTLVPLGELIRLMCDCEMTRVVMDADSQVLDVGLTQRTYAKELRRAVTTRDRHCQWPGCRIRASWSEVHHITWYSRGGPTSVDNGITACTYHHHVIHRDHVRIVPLADGFAFYRSDGQLIGTSRREPRTRRGSAVGAPVSVSGRSCPDDDRTPMAGDEHADLLAAREQFASSNGRPSAMVLEAHARRTTFALSGTAGPPGGPGTQGTGLPAAAPPGTAPPDAASPATAAPGTAPPGTCPPDAASPATARLGTATPDASSRGEPDNSGRRRTTATTSPPLTLWDASLLDQPAGPPF